MTVLILGIGLLLYSFYEKHCETKQVIAITKMEGLTFKEIDELISKIKN